MYYKIFQPPYPLKDLVRNFFVLESQLGEALPLKYQSMADGCPELIFQCKGGFLEYKNTRAYLRAQHTAYASLRLDTTLGLFGVRFYPDALQRLFHIPSEELINRVLDVKDLIGNNQIIEEVFESNNTEERIKLVCQFLAKRLNSKTIDPVHKLVRAVMHSDGNIDIAEMRNLVGLSPRQFERRFKGIAGFAPKHYARMMRFQSTKRKYVSGKYNTLAELAHYCDYADQSHFIREFKEFSGMTPTQYFKLLDQDDNSECQVIKNLIIAKDRYPEITVC